MALPPIQICCAPIGDALPPARPLPAARRVEAAAYSDALRDQNIRRDGAPVPDFAPTPPRPLGAHFGAANRDLVDLTAAGGAGDAAARRSDAAAGSPARAAADAPAASATGYPRLMPRLGEIPAAPEKRRVERVEKTYRASVLMVRGMTMDVLA